MEKRRCTAVILAAGSGRRMNSTVAKQFMLLGGKPLIFYALNAIEQSEIIDDCILVTGKEDIEYVKKEIVERFSFHKVDCVIEGGDERYASVAKAMKVIERGELRVQNQDGLVFVHDGARPFLTEEILQNTYRDACLYHACVAAVPSKDTIKIADEAGFAKTTPDRKWVWNVQTPQVFDTSLITSAYSELMLRLEELKEKGIAVTDDAGVVELFGNCKIRLSQGSYENLKITTPEDLIWAESLINRAFSEK